MNVFIEIDILKTLLLSYRYCGTYVPKFNVLSTISMCILLLGHRTKVEQDGRHVPKLCNGSSGQSYKALYDKNLRL